MAAARSAIGRGEVEEALDIWAIMRLRFPEDPAAFIEAGNALKGMGRINEAEIIFSQAPAACMNLVDKPIDKAHVLNTATAWCEPGLPEEAAALSRHHSEAATDKPNSGPDYERLDCQYEGDGSTVTAPRVPTRWSNQKLAELELLSGQEGEGDRDFAPKLASAQLAAVIGDYDRAADIAVGVLEETGKGPLPDELFIDMVTTLLVVQRFDLAGQVLQQQFALGCTVVLTIAVPGPGPNLVQWEVNLPGHMTFAFDPSLLQTDRTRDQVLWFVWLCPLFAHFARTAQKVVGRVVVNQADCGLVPGLAMCDWRPDMFLIPDNVFIPTKGYEHIRRHYHEHAIQWQNRRPVAFWRGGTTGQQRDPALGWRGLPRIRLCQIASSRPDIFDVGISHTVQIVAPAEIDEIRASGLMRSYVPTSEFHQYKYQIDIDGNTNSWPGLFQKLLTGSPVLKIASPQGYRQWYYDDLKPWKNFVPVASDIGDLHEKVEWLIAHDEVARQIGEAGRNLAEALGYEQEMKRGADTIRDAFAYFGR